jgi:hypothetical protein
VKRWAEKSVPEEYLKVARYEVPGNGAEDGSVLKGRSKNSALGLASVSGAQMAIHRPIRIRDGVAFKKRDPALRTGLLSNVPPSFAPPLLEARSRPPSYGGQAGTREVG